MSGIFFEEYSNNKTTDPEQIQRRRRACAPRLKPLKLNERDEVAVFRGAGGERYTTSLKECQCIDFERRQRPCKHMFRLAHELGYECLGEGIKIANAVFNSKGATVYAGDVLYDNMDEVRESCEDVKKSSNTSSCAGIVLIGLLLIFAFACCSSGDSDDYYNGATPTEYESTIEVEGATESADVQPSAPTFEDITITEETD